MPDGYRSVLRPSGLQRLAIDRITDDEPRRFNRNSEDMSSIEFVESYVANQIIIPNDPRSYDLTYDKLEDVEALGRGNFGIVRKMIFTTTGTAMAVKRIRIAHNYADNSSVKSMQRFKQEVETCKVASNCDEIVKFFGITFHEGDAWMCMELMDLSLDKLYMISHTIAKVEFQEASLGSVAVATINALEHLKNEHKIIHRDIKPSNILLDRHGSVKLCDFGICGYLQNSVAQSVDAGCRPYMAPERIVPDSEGYDIKSDVWSLGVSMVEVANGSYPYPGFATSPIFNQIRMVVHGDPPILHATHFSPDMMLFIAQCTIKDKAARADLPSLKDTEVYRMYSTSDYKLDVGQFVFSMYGLRNQLPF